MKRLFTLLTFVLLAMSAIAQQRMNFLGQPLGCSLATFKQRMVAKGFKYQGEVESNIHCFDGVFGGEDASIGAVVTPKSKTVYTVVVIFLNYSNDSSNRTSLNFKNSSLVDSFTNKYGEHTENVFNNESYTSWYLSYGHISIAIQNNFEHPLRLYYTDNVADEKNKREQESDY